MITFSTSPTLILEHLLRSHFRPSLSNLILASCLLVFSISAIHAHNGAVAYVRPMPAVTVDGDLNDWSAGMLNHPMEKIRVGIPAENKQDLSAHFRIGYTPNVRKIFIALEVIDQSIMLDTSEDVNWDTHDGVELYLDPNHSRSDAAITQFSEYAMKRFAYGGNRSWDIIEMKMRRTPQGRNYEWAIKLDRALTPGISLAMDLVVIDKDEDGSYSWLAWGEHAQKLSNPNRCGDLILIGSNTTLHDIGGTIDMSDMLSGPTPLSICFENVSNPSLWLQARSDSTGAYKVSLPAGTYKAYVPQEMVRVENSFYRMAMNPPVTIRAVERMTEPVHFSVRQEAPPQYLNERGMLFEYAEGDTRKVDKFIQTYQEYYDIPGISLALIKDAKVVYHKTYGVKSTKTGEPVDDHTLFEAASITKPVFGFLVLGLSEKGIIDLDKPLYEYLPFDALDVTPEYRKMTARHVLTHRSGLPNWGIPLINTPGTIYGYSGEGFEYLKRVVCKITDQDIEALLDEFVINPLDLYHMEFKDSEALREVAAIGHQGNQPTNGSIPQEPGMAHSMHTEAKAFSRFAIALLNKLGLKPHTYEEMMRIHTESPSEWWSNPNYEEGAGLGIHVRKSPHGKVIGHGGNNGDFKCLFEVYKDLNMGYVVFTNSSMGDQLCRDMADFIVEGKRNPSK